MTVSYMDSVLILTVISKEIDTFIEYIMPNSISVNIETMLQKLVSKVK